MTRKPKRIMARILAVVMAVTLVPSNMWGIANVVSAEETSEVFTEENTDVSVEDVQEPQEEVSEKETSEPSVVADDEEDFDSLPVDVEETVDDEKDAGVKAEKKEAEKVSVETDNKSEDGVHVHNFTGADGNYTATSDYFKISGDMKSGPEKITYGELTLTAAIKLGTDTVKFTAEREGTLTLVVARDNGERNRGVVVDGKKYEDASGVVVIEKLSAGDHIIAKGDAANLYYISFVETGAAKEKVAAPTASPDSGEVAIGDTITLSCTTGGATICYTTNGSDPTSTNTGSPTITITGDMVNDNKVTIKAYAIKEGCTDSGIQTFEYTVAKAANQLAEPTADPDPEDGAVARGTTIILKSDEADASIYYTTDGTNPSVNSTLFDKNNPIEITEEMTITAIAVKQGYTTSFPATFTYTIKKPTISSDTTAENIIGSIVLDDTVIFTNQDGEEVFNIKLKAEKLTTPESAVRIEAEKLKADGGEILYYDFTLVNADNENDTVTFTGGAVTIKMPYSIVTPAANKRNDIFVLHNTDQVEVTKEADGFSFSADSFSPYTVIINPASQAKEEIIITKSGGYEEGAYAEWEAVEGADGYMAYVAKAGGDFTRIDDELIREYKDYWRVDTVGLAKGTYYIKINAVVLGKNNNQTTATVIGTGMTRALNVVSHDRSGYAWVNGSASGAYNEDGTLKSNANVIYVTEETKDKVELEVTGAESNPCVGLQNILNGYKKLGETKPLNVRIIGNVTDLEVLEDGDIVISGSGAAKRLSSGLTIEGIGEDAVVNGWGIRVKNASNVEIRNLGFMNCDSEEIDNVGLQQDNDHVWVHHCDMFYGGAGGDSDQAKGDGALDVKKSTYVTFSYNHFWDSGKCNLAGLNQETTDMCLTYHHNWYDHSDSRHPRIRFFTTHVYNNYYDGNAKYGVGAAKGGPSVFVENNYFRKCPYPMLISMQGSDVWDGSKNNYGNNATFSKEDGGIIKAYGNIMEGVERFIPYSATDDPATAWDESVDFDAYVVENRNDTVPATVKTVSGISGLKGNGSNTYSNFDTAPDFYDYTPDAAEDVPAIVMAGAGRVNGGDFKWEFDDSVDDKSYALNVELKTALVNYKSPVKAIGGNVEADVDVLQNDPNKAPNDVVSKDVSAPTASKPTGTEVAKGDKIALECTTSGAEIYYTINGGKPTKDSTHYTGAITITSTGTTTIRAVAYVGDDCSDVSIFKYTVPGGSSGDDTVVNPPTATPNGGNLKKGDTVTLNAAGDIYYTMTTDGSDPATPTASSDKYTPTTPITITAEAGTTVKIKAITISDGKSSDPATFTYTIVADTSEIKEPLSTPEANPTPVVGQTYPVNIKIGLTSKENGTIHYTLDGTNPKKENGEPSETSQILAENETIKLSAAGEHTIKAFAVKEGYPSSDVATFIYTVSENATMKQLAQPVITPASKEVEKGEQITVTITKAESDPEDTKIYYTTNGTTPEKDEHLLYTEPFTLTIDKTTTIKAIAIKEGTISSTTASVMYTVKNNDPTGQKADGIHIAGLETQYDYTGAKIIPDIEVWDYNGGVGTLLEPGVDYTVTYKNNVKPTDAAEVIVKGKGNYKGKSESKTFKIVQEDKITTGLEDLNGAKIKDKIESQVYTGEAILPDFTLTLKDNTTIKYVKNTDTTSKNLYKREDGKDMNVNVAVSNNINKGTATILVTGGKDDKGKLTSVKKTFKITPVDISSATVTSTAGTYAVNSAAPASLTVTILLNGKTVALKKGKDYTVKYSNNKKAGKATVTVTGKGNYTKKCDPKEYDVNKLDLSTLKVDAVTAYEGVKAGKVKATIVDQKGNVIALKPAQYELEIYKVEEAAGGTKAKGAKYEDDAELGAKELIYIAAKAKDETNLESNKVTPEAEFKVGIDISKAKFKLKKEVVKEYTGSAVTLDGNEFDNPTIKVNGENVPLVAGTHYKIESYSNNINKGTATAVIKGIGDYSGTKTVKFKITQKTMQVNYVTPWEFWQSIAKQLTK
ncbi:MAG: hypothetical protein HDR25_01760 [Lachnospiraceae bacterium]|nr:hypothetical protein [Lachnospiraceae bacterium]